MTTEYARFWARSSIAKAADAFRLTAASFPMMMQPLVLVSDEVVPVLGDGGLAAGSRPFRISGD